MGRTGGSMSGHPDRSRLERQARERRTFNPKAQNPAGFYVQNPNPVRWLKLEGCRCRYCLAVADS